jgi:cytochrome P450
MDPEPAVNLDLDLDAPEFKQCPYPTLAALCEATPIVFHEPTGQWLITRHADVHAALRDRRLGRVYHHKYTDEQFGQAPPDPRWAGFAEHERWSLLQLEPPDHTRIRSLIARAFTPGSVTSLRPFMERTATKLLQSFQADAPFDLIADYAQPYSVAVICELLGVPADRAQDMLDWSHAIVRMYELSTPDAEKQAANDAAVAFMDYIRDLLNEKRGHPDDRLVTRLVQVEEQGAGLSEDEIICTVIVLLNAGHEATVNTLGNGTKALMENRAQWDRLVSGEVTALTGVEEMIRFDPPLQLFERWVLDDGVVIAGQPVNVGEKVAMLFGSANRDPRKFNEPDRFDIGRGDATHVGFGGGIHFCVGAPLARLELEVSLAALVHHRPGLQLAGTTTYHDAFVIHGLTALTVI